MVNCTVEMIEFPPLKKRRTEVNYVTPIMGDNAKSMRSFKKLMTERPNELSKHNTQPRKVDDSYGRF